MSDINITPSQLTHLNTHLARLSPQEILKWALITFPGLYQSTAFGLTGLAIIDMLSKIDMEYSYAKDGDNVYKTTTESKHDEETAVEVEGNASKSKFPLEVIFVDTLYHFPETLDLVKKVKRRYSLPLHVYKPEKCESVADFEEEYGEKLWDTDEGMYDFIAKVEPIQRAYEEFRVRATITGRRKSQGGSRGEIGVIEIEEFTGLIKINPLVSWEFKDVLDYIKSNDVPYNELLDKGYRSVGDWHSTSPVKQGEDERAGRWKGKAKTECGIHETSKFAKFLAEKEGLTART